jgi:23S rRNA U2552 (ribose-2'-O)-methylase RlmE/FtsJ
MELHHKSIDLVRVKIKRFPSQHAPELHFGPWLDKTPSDLVTTKKQIEPLEENHQWELSKKMANPYELVYTLENKYFHPSISVIKPLSRSYFKLIEILKLIDFFESIPKSTQKISSAHIAEGPGGFIQAFLDLAEKSRKHVAASYAMTLKPTNMNIPGWKRATHFLQKHREVRLTYGADDTGDIYKKENQDAFAKMTNQSCYLYTADGGFDFSIDYEKQEESIFRLLVCSFLIGLRSLRADGTMIVKLFDVYSDHSQILISLVGRQFQSWGLYKPVTSRPCNSERYFIGKKLVNPQPAIDALEHIEKQLEAGLYPTDADTCIEEYEKEYMRNHLMNHMTQQMNSLQRALYYSKHSDEWYDLQLPIAFKLSQEWCRRFQVPYMNVLKPVQRLSQYQDRDDTSSEVGHPQ